MINYALPTLKDKLLKTLMTALNSALRKNHEREELYKLPIACTCS